MPTHSLEKPNFSVCFEPENSLLRVNWKGEVAEKELKEGYLAVIEVLKKNPVQRILIDNSKRSFKKVDRPEGLFEMLFHEALRIVGNTLFVALVVSQEEYYLTSETYRFDNNEHLINNYIIIERFLNCKKAEAWLASVG